MKFTLYALGLLITSTVMTVLIGYALKPVLLVPLGVIAVVFMHDRRKGKGHAIRTDVP